jgi:hypothetical protein
LLYPSWNGSRLEEVYPWGTIRKATPQANVAAMEQLSERERDEIASLSRLMLKELGYDRFV